MIYLVEQDKDIKARRLVLADGRGKAGVDGATTSMTRWWFLVVSVAHKTCRENSESKTAARGKEGSLGLQARQGRGD